MPCISNLVGLKLSYTAEDGLELLICLLPPSHLLSAGILDATHHAGFPAVLKMKPSAQCTLDKNPTC